MSGKQESGEQKGWPLAEGGHVGLGFLPAAPGANRATQVSRPVPAPIQDEDDPEAIVTDEFDSVTEERQKKKPRSLAERVGRPQRNRSAVDLVREQASKPVAIRVVGPESINPADGNLAESDCAAIVARLIGDCRVRSQHRLGDYSVFTALWASHHARATATADVQLALSSGLITRTAELHGPDALRAVVVEFNSEVYAVWIDIKHEMVLAMLQPKEVYLTGLS